MEFVLVFLASSVYNACMISSVALYAFVSVVVVSAVSLVGVFTLAIHERRLHKGLFFLVALAIGAFLGDAFLHLIPEAFAESENVPLTSLLIVSGILFFFLLEKILNWHHHHHGADAIEDVGHHLKEGTMPDSKNVLPLGRLVLVSDGLHNFIDGVIIGASYFVSLEVGIATTVAIILHEIPQELGDFGVLLHAGYSKAKALWFNFLSALLAIVGVLLALFLRGSFEYFEVFVLPFAAGTFIYIASSDLVPELHKRGGAKNTLIEFVAIAIGIAAMYALLFLE
jgi:zinc and cadmium transporter